MLEGYQKILVFNIGNCRLPISFFLVFILKEDVTADLPSWIERVTSCPLPNNLSDWMRASAALNCSGLLNGTNSVELRNIYHCMPSSYLNESFQFCSDFTHIPSGNCAVYTYQYGYNKTPNPKNCSFFLSGCPEQKFYSNELYKYKSCNDIDPKRRCYRQDPRCADDPDYLTSTVQFDRNTTTTKDEEYKNLSYKTALGVLGFLFATVILSIIVFFAILWRRRKCGCVGLIPHRRLSETIEMDEIEDDTEETIEMDEIEDDTEDTDNGIVVQLARLHYFLYHLGDKLSQKPERIEQLKYILQAAIERKIKMKKEKNCYEHDRVTAEDSEYKEIDAIKKGRDLLRFMDKKYDFYLNFFLLEDFLETVEEHGLKEECADFQKNNNELFYCKGCVSKEGRQDLRVKLDREKQQLNKDGIRAVQRDLCKLSNSTRDDDILVNGVSNGSIDIHFLVRDYLVDTLKTANFSTLYKYGLIEVTLMGHCVYRCNSKDELVHDQEGAKSKEREWLCFKVSFECAQRELVAHKRASDEIHSLQLEEEDLPDDSVVFVHHSRSDIKYICSKIFDSAPIILEENRFTSLKNVAEKGQVVILCYGEDAKNQTPFPMQIEGNTFLDNVFFFILENEFLDWECQKSTILRSLENVTDERKILLAQSTKVHLYKTYCSYLGSQFRELLKRLESSGSDRDLKFAETVRKIYENIKHNANINSSANPESNQLIQCPDPRRLNYGKYD